jgi:RHS repeat-associated protein
LSANPLNINPNFSRNSGLYRYTFNGKESDSEASDLGEGTQDYGFRIYNPSLGKFLSVDPLYRDYPWYTPFQFAGNKPIWAVDLDGAEELIVTNYFSNGAIYKTVVQVINSDVGLSIITHTTNVVLNGNTYTAAYAGTQKWDSLGDAGIFNNANVSNILTASITMNTFDITGTIPGQNTRQVIPDGTVGFFRMSDTFTPIGQNTTVPYNPAQVAAPRNDGINFFDGVLIWNSGIEVNEPVIPVDFNLTPSNPDRRNDPSNGEIMAEGGSTLSTTTDFSKAKKGTASKKVTWDTSAPAGTTRIDGLRLRNSQGNGSLVF